MPIVVALLLVIAGCSPLTAARPEALRVGIIGDQTGTESLDRAYSMLEKAVERLSGERVRVVLHTGDLVESREPAEKYRADFSRAVSIMNGLPAPWYLTAGDHDVSPPQFVPDSADRSRETLFQEAYGAIRPEIKGRLYYSFNIEAYHFIALYSHETLHADPRWGAILLAGLSPAQREWLARDLDQNRDAKAIVIFLHQPLWYNWSRWLEVHRLLRRYPVAAVIAGHFHYNQDEGEIDGVRYVTVGAAGGTVKNANLEAGGFHHVTVMTLNGRKADFTVLPLESHGARRLANRADMDRVQMLDQLLGRLWDFRQQNPIFLKDGSLVSSCAGRLPATLKLAPLGNPLDVPLTVKVKFSADRLTLANQEFDRDACTVMESDDACTLRPGKGVAVANLSSVEVIERAAPLWRGSPVPRGNVLSGTPLNVDVDLSFSGSSGEFSIWRRGSTEVSDCR